MICILLNFFGIIGNIKSRIYINDAFDIFLSIVGSIIISLLLYDIRIYLTQMKNFHKESQHSKVKLIEGKNGEISVIMPLLRNRKIPEYYCFTTERHSGSFFLKIGATIFCMMHMVHNFVTFAILVYDFIGKYFLNFIKKPWSC